MTTSSVSPQTLCSTARASIIVITVAPGLAMMPRGRSATLRGLTSGTTRGTSGSMRNSVLLSMATTPRAAASSTQCRAIEGGMSKMQTSMPSKNSGVSASMTTSSPRAGRADVLGPGGEATALQWVSRGGARRHLPADDAGGPLDAQCGIASPWSPAW